MRIAFQNWSNIITIGGRKISNLRYADAITLVESGVSQMEELRSTVEHASLDFGPKNNRNKIKITTVDRANANNNSPDITSNANCDVVQS